MRRDGRVIAAGLTKRELFAAMAMQGLCGNGAVAGAALGCDAIATLAANVADALIARLGEK